MIFLDLDNTLLDLSRPVASYMGYADLAADPSYPTTYDWAKDMGMSNDELWKRVEKAGPGFWERLPWTSWGERLLTTICQTGHDVIVVSRIVGPSSAAGKKVWADRCLPPGVPLFLTDSIKWPLAAADRFLIDDAEDNVEEWESHGGTALLVPQTYNANHALVGQEYNYLTKELWLLDLVSRWDIG